MIKKILGHSPQLVILMVLGGVIGGAYNSVMIWFTAEIYLLLGEGASFSAFVPAFAIGAASTVLFYLYNRTNYLYFRPWMSNRLHYRMHEEIFRKSMEADLSCFDDPDFYDSFVWAMDESDTRALNVLECVSHAVNFIISLITTVSIILPISPLIFVISIVRSVGSFLLGLQWNKVGKKQREETHVFDRKIEYINRIFYLPDYAKELRTSHLGKRFTDEYEKTENTVYEINLKYQKKNIGLQLIEYIFMALSWLPTVIITYELFSGLVAVAAFAVIENFMWRITYLIDTFADMYKTLNNNSLYIDKYLEFMNYQPKVVSGSLPVPEFDCLEIRNVSFRYNENTDYVLRNISLSIKKGEKIAIVGYNGAGKTTLIKLLMRFYDPTEGEILLDGVNIKEFDLKAYRDTIGAVFQDFKLFSSTIAENVLGRPVKSNEDREKVLQALRSAQFEEKAEELPNGIDTMVSREFDDEGRDFSGGESQKIAIARVFAKDNSLTIMDEPSSALDPIAEYALNRSIADKLSHSTVIFISHRLSTTRECDKIYMFAKGEVIESGSHTELVKKGGSYAEMFKVQASKYAASKDEE